MSQTRHLRRIVAINARRSIIGPRPGSRWAWSPPSRSRLGWSSRRGADLRCQPPRSRTMLSVTRHRPVHEKAADGPRRSSRPVVLSAGSGFTTTTPSRTDPLSAAASASCASSSAVRRFGEIENRFTASDGVRADESRRRRPVRRGVRAVRPASSGPTVSGNPRPTASAPVNAARKGASERSSDSGRVSGTSEVGFRRWRRAAPVGDRWSGPASRRRTRSPGRPTVAGPVLHGVQKVAERPFLGGTRRAPRAVRARRKRWCSPALRARR